MRFASTVLIGILAIGCRGAEQAQPPGGLQQDPSDAEIELHGRVLGHDGQPLAAARLSLTRSNHRKPIHEQAIADDGDVRLLLPGPGAYSLVLSEPDHTRAVLLFWVDDGDDVELSARLGTRSVPAQIEIAGALVHPRERALAVLVPYTRELRSHVAAARDEAPQTDDMEAVIRGVALEARGAIEAIDDPILAKAAALEWAWFFGQFGKVDWIDAEDLRWVLTRVPADDPQWAFLGAQVHSVFADHPELASFRAELAERQRDPGLLAQLLFIDIIEADARDDDVAIATLYARLAREYPDTLAAWLAAERYDPARPLMPGKPMPDWSYPSLDGEGSIGAAQLRGRPYLLDVWSTWCSPCVTEMPQLHDAHAAIGDAIEFVGLNMDETREIVDEFRRERWPMPWTHAWIPPAEHDALRQAWGFVGVPLLVLVDGDGTIVAVNESLRGAALLPTLRAFLDRRR